jgi:histidinol-phosphate aminotransferase
MPRFDPARALRPALRSLRGYVPIEPAEEAAQRHGVAADGVVKLDGNENPYGPSPQALAALAGAYPAHRYPDPDQRQLRAALARRHDVPPECIVAGAGSDELIDLVFRIYVEPGDRVVVASPTFGMYSFDAELHGAALVDVPRGEDWSPDLDGLLSAARDAKAVFLASPNNPTGDVLPAGAVEALLERGALVVVDEAYVEFSHQQSLASLAAAGAPMIVLRTFSKWGGLAGLRVGYGVMPREIAATFMQVKQPYSVSVAAEVAALASLDDEALLDERACTLAGERDRMAAELRATGWIEPAPSEANFLLCRLLRSDGPTVRDALRRRGVFVRYFEGGRLERHIRISAGTPQDTERLLEALSEVGAELGARAK